MAWAEPDMLGDGYVHALNVMHDAVLVVDRAGRIVFANLAVSRVFGHDQADLVGRPIEVLIAPALRGRHAQLFSAFAARPVPRPAGTVTKLVGLHRDGSVFPADVALAPLRTDDGVLFTAVVRDLSHHQRWTEAMDASRQLRQAFRTNRDRFRLSIHRVLAPMLMISLRPDGDGTIVEVNQAFCALLDRS